MPLTSKSWGYCEWAVFGIESLQVSGKVLNLNLGSSEEGEEETQDREWSLATAGNSDTPSQTPGEVRKTSSEPGLTDTHTSTSGLWCLVMQPQETNLGLHSH